MSKYTTEVRFICEFEAGLKESKGYNDIDTVIDNAVDKIFQPYYCFDNDYRRLLNQKILKHYYTREIAFETAGLWKLKLNTKMQEIMPYYNQLYKSALLEFDPFNDVDLRRENNRAFTESGTGTANSKTDFEGDIHKVTDNKDKITFEEDKHTNEHTQDVIDTDVDTTQLHWDKYNDTPQGGVEGLETDRYLTNARKNTAQDNTKGTSIENIDKDSNVHTESEKNDKFDGDEKTSTENNTNVDSEYENNKENNTDFWETIVGKRSAVSYSNRIMEFRQTFLNIDMMVIAELWDLFFTLYE